MLAPGSSVDGIAYEGLAIEFLSVEGPKDIERRDADARCSPGRSSGSSRHCPCGDRQHRARGGARIYGKEKGARTLTMGLVVRSEVRAPGGLGRA